MAFPPITKDELIELWRRIFPLSYTAPIEDEAEAQGLDVFAQAAAQFERVAAAANTTQQAYYIKPHSTQTDEPASAERRATGVLEMSRTAPAVGTLSVVRGIEFLGRLDGLNGDPITGRQTIEQSTYRARGQFSLPPTASVTSAALAGATSVAVDRIADFVTRGGVAVSGANPIAVVFANGEPANTVVGSAPSTADPYGPGTIVLGVALAGATAVGTLVEGPRLGPTDVAVECTRPGYQGNAKPGTVEEFVLRGRETVVCAVGAANLLTDNGMPDRFSPAQIGQYLRFVGMGANVGTFVRRVLDVTQGDPTSSAVVDGPALMVGAETVEIEEFADLTLTLEQPLSITGGRHGWLDAIARDRGTSRFLNESDDALRLRLCNLEDIVSPAAILRIAARQLTPLGIGFRLKETRDVDGLRGFVWDLPASLAPGRVSAWDFPATDAEALARGEVWIGPGHQTRFFVLCVGLSGAGEFGAPYDGPFPSNAWDLLAFDGFAVMWSTALQAIYTAIERARAAGVAWRLVLDPNL